MLNARWRSILLIFSLGLAACSADRAKNHYLLGERLWAERNYNAAVSEFERVVAKDPIGKLGRQALYRAAMTQSLFLSQYGEALQKFNDYIEGAGPGDPLSWSAQVHVGEILFSKLDQYDQAILHYRSLLKQKPFAKEAPEFLYRVGKSQFYLMKFDDAVTSFKELGRKYPFSALKDPQWAEKAAFEIGSSYFTQGEQFLRSGPARVYREALGAYRSFLKDFPRSELVPDAQFGIASCLEELGQLDEAYGAFAQLRSSYPSQAVIDIKLNRIKQRLSERNASRPRVLGG